ncbi:MAG: DUF1385 domain-containing protein, partial [Oscillospiraceae bacterium]|nr:DUF1385 domain-containing protein [Oscillospiraceae bacterium]
MSNNKEPTACAFKTSIGGQALIEGILMRGPDRQAIVCRKADGSLVRKEEALRKRPILRIPFLRGIPLFIDSMVNGMRALTWSAEQLPEEEQEEPSKLDLWLERKLGSEKAEKAVVGVALVLGVLLAVGLFVLLPALLFELLPSEMHLVLRCVLEGLIRIVIFIAYLWLVTRMPE